MLRHAGNEREHTGICYGNSMNKNNNMDNGQFQDDSQGRKHVGSLSKKIDMFIIHH